MSIKVFGLYEKDILEFKRSKDKKIENYIFKIKCKIIFFFIFNYIFLFFFWIYLGCFCAVYKNTQLHLIKDTLISFGASMLYPFGIYLLPGIFRIISLKGKNRDILYNISKLLQMI